MRSLVILTTTVGLIAATPLRWVPGAGPGWTGSSCECDIAACQKSNRTNCACELETKNKCYKAQLNAGLTCDKPVFSDQCADYEVSKENTGCGRFDATNPTREDPPCGLGLTCADTGVISTFGGGTCKPMQKQTGTQKEGEQCGKTRGLLKEELVCAEGLYCEIAGAAPGVAPGTCKPVKGDAKPEPKDGEEGGKCGITKGMKEEIKCGPRLKCDAYLPDVLGTCVPWYTPQKPGVMPIPSAPVKTTMDTAIGTPTATPASAMNAEPQPTEAGTTPTDPKAADEGAKCGLTRGQPEILCKTGLQCITDPKCADCLGTCRNTDPGAKKPGAKGDACEYGESIEDTCGEGLTCGPKEVGASACINPKAGCPGVCQTEFTTMPMPMPKVAA